MQLFNSRKKNKQPASSTVKKDTKDIIEKPKDAVEKKGLRERVATVMSKTWFKIARTVISTIVLLVSLYLILMPIVPQLPYYLRQLRGENVYERQESAWGQPTPDSEGLSSSDETVTKNTIEIPAVGIKVQIVEGKTDEALERGAWRRPNSSTPVDGGNMVVTGHRFKYLPPSNLTFYNLDKVEVGDDIIVYWKGKEYDYVVTDTFVVSPDRVDIESDTASPRLTLYTCTPLWTAKQRLVVIAEPAAEDASAETVPLEEIADE